MRGYSAKRPNCKNYPGSYTLGSEFIFHFYTGAMPSEKKKRVTNYSN